MINEFTVTLGVIGGLSVSILFVMRFIWKRYYSPTVSTQNGDAQSTQTGPISGQGASGIANSGDNAQFQITTIINPSQKKYGEKEKRDAIIKIRSAFVGFFWVFLGNTGGKGVINTPHNLDESNLKAFRKDRQSTIRQNLENGRERFEKELRAVLPILEDSEIESTLDDLCQKLIVIYLNDPFHITEKLREETLQEVEEILSRRKP